MINYPPFDMRERKEDKTGKFERHDKSEIGHRFVLALCYVLLHAYYRWYSCKRFEWSFTCIEDNQCTCITQYKFQFAYLQFAIICSLLETSGFAHVSSLRFSFGWNTVTLAFPPCLFIFIDKSKNKLEFMLDNTVYSF